MSVASHVIAAGTKPTTTPSATTVSTSSRPRSLTIKSVTAAATPPVSAGRRSGREATALGMLPGGIYSCKVTEGSGRSWQEVTASNRERINALEHELERMRNSQHRLASDVAVIRYLAEKVGELGEDVKELTGQVENVARRAVERPTAAVVGQYLGLAVAIIALVAALSH
jgi:hypothetical protein